jgi:hypothetical protein
MDPKRTIAIGLKRVGSIDDDVGPHAQGRRQIARPIQLEGNALVPLCEALCLFEAASRYPNTVAVSQ